MTTTTTHQISKSEGVQMIRALFSEPTPVPGGRMPWSTGEAVELSVADGMRFLREAGLLGNRAA